VHAYARTDARKALAGWGGASDRVGWTALVARGVQRGGGPQAEREGARAGRADPDLSSCGNHHAPRPAADDPLRAARLGRRRRVPRRAVASDCRRQRQSLRLPALKPRRGVRPAQPHLRRLSLLPGRVPAREHPSVQRRAAHAQDDEERRADVDRLRLDARLPRISRKQNAPQRLERLHPSVSLTSMARDAEKLARE